MKRPTLNRSPLVVAIDGTVFANVALLDGVEDPTSALHEALRQGGSVFVGVALRDGEVAETTKWLDDAAHEGLAFILGARQRRKRGPPGKGKAGA
jgi:hypothetical protein